MKTIRATLRAAWLVIRNKAAALIVLIGLMYAYASIPPVRYDEAGNKTGGMPFADLLFVAVLIAAVFGVTPIVRLLFFPEAARYAEGKALPEDLRLGQMTLNYKHYRMATIISFAVTLATFASIAH